MAELPPPDLLDTSGRMRRLVIALLVGAAIGALAYVISDALAAPDEQHATYYTKLGPYRFVWYMTAFFGAVAFAVTLAIQNHFAKKKWREQLVARAKVVS